MNRLFMGVDAGTSSMRVQVMDALGNVLADSEQAYDATYPKPGWCQQKPGDWTMALKTNIRNCTEALGHNAKDIVAIAVGATSCTCLPVNREGEPLGEAIMWMDNRAGKEADAINETYHRVLEACGGAVSVEWLVPKVLWYKNNERKLYDRAYKIVEQLDFINHQLTGKFVASKCNAVCKANYVEGVGFDEDFFRLIGLEDYREKMITKVIPTGDIIDYIDEALADEMGFSKDVQIVQGGIDAHIASYGLGVVKPGVLGLITGTSFVHLSLTDLDEKITGIWGPYQNATVQGYWLLEGGQVSAGSLVKWFMKNFDVASDDPFIHMAEEAAGVEPGAEGLVTLDFFQGNRTPYKDASAKGVIFGLTLKHTAAHIYKSILESVAFGTNNILVNYHKQGIMTDKMVACGGVTQDKRWMQIISDVTGKPIEISANPQTGVLGCCILGAVALEDYVSYEDAVDKMIHVDSVIMPNMKNHQNYKPSFEKYLALYEKLNDLM